MVDARDILTKQFPVTRDVAESVLADGCPLPKAIVIMRGLVAAGIDLNQYALTTWLLMRDRGVVTLPSVPCQC